MKKTTEESNKTKTEMKRTPSAIGTVKSYIHNIEKLKNLKLIDETEEDTLNSYADMIYKRLIYGNPLQKK